MRTVVRSLLMVGQVQTNRFRFQFSLKALLGFFVILAVVFTAVGYARKLVLNHARKEHLSRFSILLYAIDHYDDVYGQLPSAATTDKNGKLACSWRFQLRPFCDSCCNPPSRSDYSAPWNAPPNLPWAMYGPEYFAFNDDNTAGAFPTTTNVFAITGPETAFDGQKPCSLNELDGDTILIIEVVNSATHWMQPGDFDVHSMSRTIGVSNAKGISGCRGDGFCVGFADGEAWFMRNDTPFEAVSKFFTIEGAKAHNRKRVLGKYRLVKIGKYRWE